MIVPEQPQTELERVTSQITKDPAFAEAIVKANGENLRGWYTLTDEERREAVHAAKLALLVHAALAKRPTSPSTEKVSAVEKRPEPDARVRAAGRVTAGELLQHYEAGQRDFRGIQLVPDHRGQVHLNQENLQGADLRDLDLSGVDLADANLSGGDLSGANLSRAVLVRTIFRGAKLRDANLSGANVKDATFENADLTGANLSNAQDVPYFKGAILNGADLSGMEIYQAWKMAASFAGLILPDGSRVGGASPASYPPGTQAYSPATSKTTAHSMGCGALAGAPIEYIAVLAAAILVLSFIPITVGGPYVPRTMIHLGDGVWPLAGWLLGPIAGGVASGIGTLLAGLLQPRSLYLAVTVANAIFCSLTAGAMVLDKARNRWWIPVAVLVCIAFLLLIGRAVVHSGVGLLTVIFDTFPNWSAILLFMLPTRTIFARWIHDKSKRKVALGLFLGTWMVNGLVQVVEPTIYSFWFDWSADVWTNVYHAHLVRSLLRCAAGAVIGTVVIAALRDIFPDVKPKWAIY